MFSVAISLVKLSKQLTKELGKGFSRSNLQNMRSFYTVYQNCQTVSSKLSWSHYCELIPLVDADKRSFYEQETMLHLGIVDGMKEVPGLLLQIEITRISTKAIKTLSKSYNEFSKATTGQFTGFNHNKLRSMAYKSYKLNFELNVDFGAKVINTAIDIAAPIEKAKTGIQNENAKAQ